MITSLAEYLEGSGLEVIDKRDKGGNLTVVGDRFMIEAVITEAERLFGIRGWFSDYLRAAHKGPGWWTQAEA